jgi:hypothetical protein
VAEVFPVAEAVAAAGVLVVSVLVLEPQPLARINAAASTQIVRHGGLSMRESIAKKREIVANDVEREPAHGVSGTGIVVGG